MYCEFHEQKGHTTAGYPELKNALHKLTDKGQIDCFLKRGPRALRKQRDPVHEEPREEEYSTEIVATIASRCVEDITWSACNA